MLVQLFAFTLCCTALAVSLMVQQLPEHRKLDGTETAQTATTRIHGRGENDSNPATRSARCSDLRCKNRGTHLRPADDTYVEVDPPQEEPELD